MAQSVTAPATSDSVDIGLERLKALIKLALNGNSRESINARTQLQAMGIKVVTGCSFLLQ